jgi:hypothetical protein
MEGVSMEGVNPDTVQGKFFELLINNINANIKLLDEYGAKIKDNSDFDYYLKEIRYSSAQDEVLAVFRPIEKGG